MKYFIDKYTYTKKTLFTTTIYTILEMYLTIYVQVPNKEYYKTFH